MLALHPTPPTTRQIAVSAVVVAAHIGALWAVQQGVSRPPQDAVEAPVILVDLTPATPLPAVAPTAPPPPTPPKAAARPVVPRTQAQTPTAPPTPEAVAPAPAPTPAPALPAPVPAPPSAAVSTSSVTAAAATPVTAAPVATTPPAPPKVEQPSSRADYLNNPKPAMPTVSRRLGEQGLVTLRVFIDAQGQPTQVEVLQSSGYTRLDDTARNTVLQSWRFVPGKRNGVAEAMWVNVPIQFVLK